MNRALALRGPALWFKADPFTVPPEDALGYDSDAMLVQRTLAGEQAALARWTRVGPCDRLWPFRLGARGTARQGNAGEHAKHEHPRHHQPLPVLPLGHRSPSLSSPRTDPSPTRHRAWLILTAAMAGGAEAYSGRSHSAGFRTLYVGRWFKLPTGLRTATRQGAEC